MSWHHTALEQLTAAFPAGGWEVEHGDIFGRVQERLVIVTRDRGWIRASITVDKHDDVDGMDPRDAARAVGVALDRLTGARRPLIYDASREVSDV